MKPSTDVTGGTPSSARMALKRGNIGRSNTCLTIGRAPASRRSPIMPGSGRIPGPNGGTPRERRYGVNGEKSNHGMSPASAADKAPQQFASTMTASGRIASTARRKSPTSCTARRHSTSIDNLSTPNAFRACPSLPAIASMSGATASACTPTDRIAETPADMVRR